MFRKISSVFLVLCSLILAIFLTFFALLRWNLQEESIVSYIKGSDLSFVLDATTGARAEFLEKVEEYFLAINVPEDTLEKVLNSDSTKEFVGKYLASAVNYLVYQKEEEVITSQDVENLVTENIPVIEEALKSAGLDLSEEEKAKILDYTKEYADDVAYFFPTASEILKDVSLDSTRIGNISLTSFFEGIKIITSTSFLLLMLGILFFLLLILWLINKGKRSTYFKVYFFLYALLFIFVEIILGTIVKDFLMSNIQVADTFINYMINEISKSLWIFILCSLVLSFICSRIKKERKDHNEKISGKLCERDGEETENENK